MERRITAMPQTEIDLADRDISLMIEDTEKEIFDYAADPEDGYALGNEALEELSQPEGWDGPISDAELFTRAIEGDPPTGHDKPLELAEEYSAMAEVEQLKATLAQREQQLVELMHGPQIQAQLQANQEARRDALFDIAMDPARADAHLAEVDQLKQGSLNNGMARFNASMEGAHRNYGKDFENAYKTFFAMDPQNEVSHALIRQVTTAPDPGEAMMQLADNPLVRGLAHGRPPPFMPPNSSYRGRGGGPISSDDMGTNSGYGDQDVEDAIFKAAIG
jgi:hypothetical protein